VTGRNVYGQNLLIRTVGIDTFYYMYNGHADVTALLTPSGQVAATYYYDAFGNVLETTGNVGISILDFVHDYSGPIDQSDRFKYNFIEPAIRDIRNAQEQGRENISWLISITGYSVIDITNFEQTAEDFGVNIVFFSNADEFINYINTGDTLREEGVRDTKIDYLSVFSHGAPGKLMFGYHQDNEEELNVYLDDIQRIERSAFSESSNTCLYSCGSASEKNEENNRIFAKEWAAQTGSITIGFDGRTNYVPVNYDKNAEAIAAARETFGYDQRGAYIFPYEGFKYNSEQIKDADQRKTVKTTYP